MVFMRSIAPHFLQFVKLSLLGQHDMHYDIYIVDQYPLQVLLSFVVVRVFAAHLFDLLFYKVTDSPDLGLVASLANDKKISHSLWYLSQVYRNDVFTLFILYRPYDGFKNLRVLI